MAREDLLARTFVQLAAAWDDEIDLKRAVEMVTERCVELFETSAAGILLIDTAGEPHVSAATSDETRTLQLFELDADEGACLDCYRSGRPVSAVDLAGERRWPRFAPTAVASGFASVHAVPVRVRDHVIGSLNLFGATTDRLSDADLLAAEALAQATAFTILRPRALGGRRPVVGRLQPALNDRLTVEQAKGVLAGRAGVSIDEADRRIRRYARHHSLELNSVCQEIVAGTLTLLTYDETRRLRHPAQDKGAGLTGQARF